MEDLSNLHFVNIGPLGQFRASGQINTSPKDIDELFSYLESENKHKLLIHFHGGLVSEANGVKSALRLIPEYAKTNSHPIIFIWESGLLETLRDNIYSIVNTELAKLIIKYVIQKIEKNFGLSSGAKGPSDEFTFEKIEQEMQADEPFKEQSDVVSKAAEDLSTFDLARLEEKLQGELLRDLARSRELKPILEDDVPNIDLLDKEFKNEFEDEAGVKGVAINMFVAKTIAKITLAVIQRFTNKRDHGLYPTIVEETLRTILAAEFGVFIWDRMKAKAQEMWYQNSIPLTEESYVGGYFLDKLDAFKTKYPKLIIDVVGHSAGAIAISYLLGAMSKSYPNLKVRNVVFLAPGCTLELFNREVMNHPDQFDIFRMYTLKDMFEIEDKLIPGVYTRSLLYFVSGVVERVPDEYILGMERFWGGDYPYGAPIIHHIRNYLLEEGKNRVVLTTTSSKAKKGFRSNASTHTDFTNDLETLSSIKSMLA